MKLSEKDQGHFFDLETSLHRTHVRTSPDTVSALLADDFVEFGKSDNRAPAGARKSAPVRQP
jgi:hypothetical protein